MKKILLTGLALLFLLASCSSPGHSGAPTAARLATATAAPSATILPTPTDLPRPPVTVSYYPLRLEYRVTSDWASLEFREPARILAVRQVELSCAGLPCSPETKIGYSTARVEVNRPFSQVKKEPEVLVILDLAVSPEGVDAPFDLISKHGAYGGSGLRILYNQRDDWAVLKEINHFWVDSSNADTSAAKFSVDMVALAQNSAAQEVALGASRPEKLALAFYYPWFPDYGWSDDTAMSDKPLIEISSDDMDSVDWQIAQAQSAGVDGFVMSYNSSWADSRTQILMRAAEKRNFKFCFLLETLDSGGPPWPPDLLGEWLVRAYRKFAPSPAYLKLDGKPVLFVYASTAHSLETWDALFTSLREQGVDFVYIATGYDIQNLTVFDGIFDYAIFSYEDLPGAYLSTSRAVRNYSIFEAAPAGKNKLWVATVSPGFNSTPYGENLHPFAFDRGQGEYYLKTIDAALRSDPDWIVITSWNEYGENTHIEPSQRDGELFLNLTREFISKWKSASP